MNISNKIPWWFKILLKLLLSRLPFNYSLWSKLNLFKHGDMNSFQYAYKIFLKHVDTETISLKNKVILELGPGDSLATGLIASSYDASSILINPSNFESFSMKKYSPLLEFLGKEVKNIKDHTNCDSINDFCHINNITYLTDGTKSLETIKSNSVDIIFTNAVLEHVYYSDFENVIKQFQRVLKKDGYMSHQIDLKDHLGGSLNNLRFSKKIWETDLFKTSGFYTNRIRYKKMNKIFNKYGFKEVRSNITKWNDLPIKKDKLDHEFRNLDTEDLLISGFFIKMLRNKT